ncbi:MAG: tetratricopeptide repeat protein [Saprospiraceae bacterium]|nr:tetratricopeptide repeat protein [Saprospiraceae bacterium]
MKIAWLIWGCLFVFPAFAQSGKKLREGNEQYKDGNYDKAESLYQNDNENPTYPGMFNLGNSRFKQEKFKEALTDYDKASDLAKSKKEKAAALYNKGNTHFKSNQFKEAIDAYKDALRFDPSDVDAQGNLLKAKQQLRQQQQQQQQQDEQKGNGSPQRPQDPSEKDNQGESKLSPADPEHEKNNPPQPNQDTKKGEIKGDRPNAMESEEARKTLDMIAREDQKVQEKLKRGKDKKNRPKKDW